MDLFDKEKHKFPELIPESTCGKCEHVIGQKYQHCTIYYCEITPSNRTANGHKKVKYRQLSCEKFKERIKD
jgi:hypothetical protein